MQHDNPNLDTPMKKLLAVMNIRRLAVEINVPYWSMNRYLKGKNEDMRHSDYKKIQNKIQTLFNDL